MSNLGAWLRNEIERRRLTQAKIAVYAGVGQATISDILHRGHIPKVETLFRLADCLQTPRDQVLRLAGHLPRAPQAELAATSDAGVVHADPLVQALLDEFRKVPPDWQEEAIAQVALFARLAGRPPLRIIGEEPPDEAAPSAVTQPVGARHALPCDVHGSGGETEDDHEAESGVQAA